MILHYRKTEHTNVFPERNLSAPFIYIRKENKTVITENPLTRKVTSDHETLRLNHYFETLGHLTCENKMKNKLSLKKRIRVQQYVKKVSEQKVYLKEQKVQKVIQLN